MLEKLMQMTPKKLREKAKLAGIADTTDANKNSIDETADWPSVSCAQI